MPLRFFGKHRETIRDMTTLIAVAMATFSVISVYIESGNRRDQNCKNFERQEAVAVGDVISTQNFLNTLPTSEYGTPIVKAIVRTVPQRRREAYAAKAPDYCDDPGVGIDDPPPKVPKERNYDQLLHKPAGEGQ